jgi:hypothetical protein
MINITRKIQLIIDSKDKEFIKQTYEMLYRWQYICFRSANYLFTHHFVQDQIKDMLYLTDDMRLKLADVHKDPNGMLVTSKANTTYRLLGNYFKGSIPMPIISCLNRKLVNAFYKDVDAYRKGERSLRNFKKNTGIPFNAENLRKLSPVKDGKYFSFKLFSIPFRTYLGRGHDDKRKLLHGVLTGEVKFCSSSLTLDKSRIFMLAAFEMEPEKHELNDEVIAEANLSIDYPVIVKIGRTTYTIGTKEEFLHRRLAIQAARTRVLSAVKYCRGKNGIKRKKKCTTRYRDAEKNYVSNKLHVYSRRLIDLCIKHHAATLILVNQEEKEAAAKVDPFILRNWSYSELKDKIQYKAAKAGITVITE